MPSSFKIDATCRNKGVDGIVDQLDVGAGPGVLKIFTGAAPANPAAADTGTLLATLTLAKPAFGNGGATAGTGVARAAAIAPGTAVANGTAGHYRAYDSSGNCRMQGSAGIAGDTPDLTLDDKVFVIGGTVTIVTWDVGVPEA